MPPDFQKTLDGTQRLSDALMDTNIRVSIDS
jgi:hypothetical protein